MDAEVQRVRAHLRDAEAFAAGASIARLDAAQRLTRALLLDELARYRDEGVFPKNHDSPSPRPTFIDDHGTRCAMAHLMEIGGAGDLVEEIARTKNHAYVDELTRDARVGAWLRAAGLTVEEAARIQPSYCPSAAECACIVAVDRVVWEGTVLARETEPGFSDVYSARVDVVVSGPDANDAGDGGFVLTPDSGTIVQSGAPLVAGQRFVAMEITPIATIEEGEVMGTTCLALGNYPPLPSMTKQDLLALIGKGPYEQCQASIVADDPAFANRLCDDRRPPRPGPDAGDAGPATTVSADPSAPGDDGCSLSASSSPESVSVLLAVLSALAVGRRVRLR